jgi:Domain of unknown function (DUF4258)
MAELTYSTHARERMQERGVSDQDVELALKRPIRTRPGDPGTLWIDGHGTGGRVISVNVQAADKTFIITVGWPKESSTKDGRSRR